MIAFAGNSIICRLALGEGTIDAASFTTIRLISGAAMLWLVVRLWNRDDATRARGSWLSAASLFLYAISFSFAYLTLTAGTGALILFGVVQATMILAALWSGERPGVIQWTGLVIAIAGLVVLVSPGLSAPSPVGSLLMALAGIAWGVYSLRGRNATDPAAETADNFLRTVPMVLVASLINLGDARITTEGVGLALTSGAIASGLGYVIWYTALRGLTATRAATVQLSVPVLAALGGVLLLSEPMTVRFIAASILILGGVGLTLLGRSTDSPGT